MPDYNRRDGKKEEDSLQFTSVQAMIRMAVPSLWEDWKFMRRRYTSSICSSGSSRKLLRNFLLLFLRNSVS